MNRLDALRMHVSPTYVRDRALHDLGYGSCAMLAWEDGKVVGQLRFYPLKIMRLLKSAAGEADAFWSALPDDSVPGTLEVRCVMTTRPFKASAQSKSLSIGEPGNTPDLVTEASGSKRFRTAEEAGGRRG
jgi:hypothetical protein